MKVILASKSPRRKELLGKLGQKMGFEFEIITRDVDESLEKGIAPFDGVRMLAERKGAAVAALPEARDKMIISSDTLVELDGVALGKPKDKKEAKLMLSSISGRSHFVRTGVAVFYNGRVFSGTASTEVVFSNIPEREIDLYIESGDPMDKAGAYAIQGYIGKFVKEYIGDYDTVVGLSLSLTEELIHMAVGGERFD